MTYAFINDLSHDVLAHLMGFVPDVHDWSRLLAAANQTSDVQWRLLNIKPETLIITLDDVSSHCLQQMADYRLLHPNINSWPRHLHLKLTNESSATHFVVLLLPLMRHAETFKMSMDEIVDAFKPNSTWTNRIDDNKKYVDDLDLISDGKYPIVLTSRFNIRLSPQSDVALVKHLPLSKDHCNHLQQWMQQSSEWTHDIHIGITASVHMANITTLNITLYENWSATYLASWPLVIAHAPCLVSLQVDFVNVSHGSFIIGNMAGLSSDSTYRTHFKIPYVSSPYLTTMAIRAHCDLTLILPSTIPSLRHLTLGAKNLSLDGPTTVFELESLDLQQYAFNGEEDCVELYRNKLYNPKSLQKMAIRGLCAYNTGQTFLADFNHLFQNVLLLTDLTVTSNGIVKQCLDLKEGLPTTLTRLVISAELYFWSNQCTDLTPLIKPLHRLESLHIRRIASALGKHQQNHYICDIRRFPKSITWLNLSDNKTEDLLDVNYNDVFPKLTYLNVSKPYGTYHEEKTIQWLQSLPLTLRHLNIASFSFPISKLPDLTYLNLLQSLDLRFNRYHTSSFTIHDGIDFHLVNNTFLNVLPTSLKRLWLPVSHIVKNDRPFIVLTRNDRLKHMIMNGMIDIHIILKLEDVFVSHAIVGVVPYRPSSPLTFDFKKHNDVEYWQLHLEPIVDE